jgi:hypothetical protein
MTIIQLRTGNTQIDQKAILAANDQRYSRRVGAWIIYSFTCIKICIYIYIHTYINTYAYTHTRVLQKKNSHPVTVIAKKLACPISPNSMLLHRFAWIGKYSHFRSDAGMHWATTLIKGARGDQV